MSFARVCSFWVLHLLTSYGVLQSHLEGEAEKDAMQKSDAAREAFLAELAKDKKSPMTKEAELLKQSRDKPKDKKRLKDQKKPKDVKVVVSLFSFFWMACQSSRFLAFRVEVWLLFSKLLCGYLTISSLRMIMSPVALYKIDSFLLMFGSICKLQHGLSSIEQESQTRSEVLR